MGVTYIQVRADEEDKRQAAEILVGLGTNLSTVVNMLLKQIIRTKSIPFEIRLDEAAYTNEEIAQEVDATLRMEGMNLTGDELARLRIFLDEEIAPETYIDKIVSANKVAETLHEDEKYKA
jgi:addiction module RelB/DinJ family antitoxin